MLFTSFVIFINAIIIMMINNVLLTCLNFDMASEEINSSSTSSVTKHMASYELSALSISPRTVTWNIFRFWMSRENIFINIMTITFMLRKTVRCMCNSLRSNPQTTKHLLPQNISNTAGVQPPSVFKSID